MVDPAALRRIVIVGAGQAGAQAAVSLRQNGFDGDVVLIGAEPDPPYQRPPLSKAFLKGELAADRLHLKPPEFYDAARITTRFGVAAAAIDRAARQVRLAGGGAEAYDALILATGAQARRLGLPGAASAGVHVLRTRADVDAIRPRLTPGARVAIVGCGYIGLEVAAVARRLGAAVVALEAAERVMPRTAGPEIAGYFDALHRAEGVDLRLAAQAAAFEGDGALTGIRLADGGVVPADLAIVGVGVVPDVALAQDAGLTCEDGILVDDDGRTSDPRIFAAGDCARRPRLGARGTVRLESVHNAIDLGKRAAAALAGRPRPKDEAPWFWSDQYDAKLQTVGLGGDRDQAVVRGDPEAGAFAVFALKDGRIIAVDAVNQPAVFMAAKRLVLAGAQIDPAVLADPESDLRALAKAEA